MKFRNHGMVIIVLCSLMVVKFTCPWLDSIDLENGKVELLSTQEMRFVYISFVRVDGEKFLIKQKKSGFLRKVLGVVRDAVMAHFAENFMNAHQVDILPAGKVFPGKIRTDWPATIHTIAPGRMIKDQNSRYNHMNIKQADVGFRYDMLSWMSKHIALIKTVAYDTFFCNHDRHRGNLFYNSKDDSFCAIDMDSSFKYNLCALACRNFKLMLESNKLWFKSKEIKALALYRQHLQFLIDNCPPKNTLKIYDYFVEKAGFIPGSPLYTPTIDLEIKNNKYIIARSYEDAKKLVKIVDNLIEKIKKHRQYSYFAIKN